MPIEIKDIGSAIAGMQYVKYIIQGRKVVNRTRDYIGALNDIEIHIDAAIERLNSGEGIFYTCSVSKNA